MRVSPRVSLFNLSTTTKFRLINHQEIINLGYSTILAAETVINTNIIDNLPMIATEVIPIQDHK